MTQPLWFYLALTLVGYVAGRIDRAAAKNKRIRKMLGE